MNGFREELVSSLSGINGDITVYEADEKDLLNDESNNFSPEKILKVLIFLSQKKLMPQLLRLTRFIIYTRI